MIAVVIISPRGFASRSFPVSNVGLDVFTRLRFGQCNAHSLHRIALSL
jgi:hypothetical protein